MNDTVKHLIQYRLDRANESYNVASFAVRDKLWNSAASALYYTAFYMIQALFAKHQINASTHSGVMHLFSMHFIKEGKIEVRWGKLANKLFDLRQDADYGDFVIFTEGQIIPLFKEVDLFINVIKSVIEE